MRFLLPQGIGDSIWGMTKVQSIAKKLGDGKVHVALNTSGVDHKEGRAVEFIGRFGFVSSVSQYQISSILKPGHPTDEEGHYRYIDSGPDNLPGIDYTLIPNTPLERGLRLETWLPEFETNWKIMEDYQFKKWELDQAEELEKEIGPYCVFFLGALLSNTGDGHNRGPLWKPEDWAELGRRITQELRLKVVVVGAPYDLSYWIGQVYPLVREQHWVPFIGNVEISETLAYVKRARFVVSFQSGIGIVAEYLGVPTAIFWRPKGDSISPSIYLSFEEEMRNAWVPPAMLREDKHLGLIYGRHDVSYVFQAMRNRNWSQR